MDSAATGMRQAFEEIRQESGGIISAESIQDEILELRRRSSPSFLQCNTDLD